MQKKLVINKKNFALETVGTCIERLLICYSVWSIEKDESGRLPVACMQMQGSPESFFAILLFAVNDLDLGYYALFLLDD